MAEYDKPALDAQTDQAVMTLRGYALGDAAEQNAAVIAAALAAQFPGCPDLGRIIVAVSELQSTLALKGCGHASCVIATTGRAGARLVPAEEVPGG